MIEITSDLTRTTEWDRCLKPDSGSDLGESLFGGVDPSWAAIPGVPPNNSTGRGELEMVAFRLDP